MTGQRAAEWREQPADPKKVSRAEEQLFDNVMRNNPLSGVHKEFDRVKKFEPNGFEALTPNSAERHLPRVTIEDNGKKLTPADSRVERKEPVAPITSNFEAKKYELNLKHSVHGGKSADAVVLLPKNFDATKPINLVIYNHGWRDTASSSFRNANLQEQMKAAPPNTVLIVPEWQVNPGGQKASGNQQGAYASKDFATKMVQDVFDKTPELKGKTLADVRHIGLISHSAGFIPTKSQLAANPELSKKVNSVTLLDSLYDTHGFNGWIKSNIADLASGEKKFQNIFGSSTHGQSMEQAKFVARELAAYKGEKRGDKQGVLFKPTNEGHMEIPRKFVRSVMESATR